MKRKRTVYERWENDIAAALKANLAEHAEREERDELAKFFRVPKAEAAEMLAESTAKGERRA